jgi:hypothetical protein
MPTAWQLLMKKLHPDPPQSKHVLNPFQAGIGASVELDKLDWRGKTFLVKEIREVSRPMETGDYKFVDYTLVCRAVGKDDVWVRLRLIPIEGADKHSDMTHNCLILSKYDEIKFDQAFRDLLNDPEFSTQQDGVETGHFWRINDCKAPYDCSVKVVDEGNDKQASVPSSAFLLWDYWREHPDEAGQPTKEYLFVEMEKDNGFFTLWRGEDIDPQRVSVV